MFFLFFVQFTLLFVLFLISLSMYSQLVFLLSYLFFYGFDFLHYDKIYIVAVFGLLVEGGINFTNYM